MDATVQLPEALLNRLERLAVEEGTSLDGLLQRLVSEHVEHRRVVSGQHSRLRRDVQFPLIPREVTGEIRHVTGAEIDEMFALDDFIS